MQYVILGGGIAGTTAAENLRKLSPDSEITIIEREPYPLYSRILLPFYIKGKIEREKVFLKKMDWYVENQITFMSGIEALEIDTKNKFVRTSEEREIPYDKLLIATGAEPGLLKDDLRGITYFRTLDDADNILVLVNEAMTLSQKERKAIVLGGGFIALEYINIFHHFGIKTTVLMRSSGFWSRILSAHSQEVLLNHAKENGVEILLNLADFEIIGEKEFEGVQLQNGEKLDAKILGVGIGMKCDKMICTETDIDFDSGVLADSYLLTSKKDIYTAGDVAEYFDFYAGRTLRLPSWMNAQSQGRQVAKNIFGENGEYKLVSSFSANLLGLDIVFIGDTDRAQAEEVIQYKKDKKESIEIFVRNGVIIGTVLIGGVEERQKITDAIKNKQTYKEYAS